MIKKVLDLLNLLAYHKIYGKLIPILEHGKVVRVELKISMLEPDLDKFIKLLRE